MLSYSVRIITSCHRILVQSLDIGHGDAIVHQGQLLCRLPHEHLVELNDYDLLSQVAEVLGDQALDPRFPRACR